MTISKFSLFRSILLSAVLGAAACGSDDTNAEMDVDAGMESDEVSFRVTVTNNLPVYPYLSSGVAAVPVGAEGPGPLFPGDQYEVTFAAAPGDHLSLATMMVQSNDLFYSMGQWGIPLFDGVTPRGNIELTSDMNVYDAGTEENEELGVGQNQAARNSSLDAGDADSNPFIRLATVEEFPNLPAVSEVVSASVESIGGGYFRLTVGNVSNMTTLSHSNGSSAVPLSPVAFAVHRQGENPLFDLGQSDLGEGLEALAEIGSATELHATLSAQTGVTSPFSPGVYAVHTDSGVIFNSGNADRGQGLEALAEDGSPAGLSASLQDRSDVQQAGVFNMPLGETTPGPIASGQSYEFDIVARPGDKLSLATMYIQSNDVFVSFGDAGLELFNGTVPADGDVSSQLLLLDAGTEENELPGSGPSQAPRQSEGNQGDDELGVVRPVDDGFAYPQPWELISVSITPL